MTPVSNFADVKCIATLLLRANVEKSMLDESVYFEN